MIKHAVAIACLILLTGWLFISNEYMTQRQVQVEVEDKALRQDSKGNELPVVIYKRADGLTFERTVTIQTWFGSLPGERKTISVRQFDMRQSAWENARYFFLPCISLAFTGTYLLMYLAGVSFGSFKLRTNDKKEV